MLLLSAAAYAHPGHGTTDPESLAHQVGEPVHLLPWGLTVLIALAGWLLVRQSSRRS
jgi:hypothetical protein